MLQIRHTCVHTHTLTEHLKISRVGVRPKISFHPVNSEKKTREINGIGKRVNKTGMNQNQGPVALKILSLSRI